MVSIERESDQRSAHRAERREVLLDAAVVAIRRDGPGASMEAMAAAAGVTKPILYRNFGDRDGLVDALATRYSKELVGRIGESLGEAVEPQEVLRSSIDSFVAFIEADPELYRFMMLQVPQGTFSLMALHDLVARRVADVLAERIPNLPGGRTTAEIWAYAIVGMVNLAGDWWSLRRPVDRRRLVDDLTRLLWGGLGDEVAEPARTA